MRRFITITIIVLIIIAITLFGVWYFTRKGAQKRGETPPTFKQFLNGETTTITPPSSDGNLSSVFIDNNLTTETPSGSNTSPIGTQVAQFTNSTASPTSGGASGSSGTSGTNNTPIIPGSGIGTDPTTTTPITIDPTTQTPTQVPPIIAGPECSNEDLNIQFSATDLNKLQILQNRFYAIAQTLHTDADVATETGNHDNFRAKVDKVTYLYNRCVAYSSNLAQTSQYSRRVPTPFWHADMNLGVPDTELFIGDTSTVYDGDIGGNGTWNGSVNGITPAPPTNTSLVLRSLQRSLRLNIW